jgi:phenylpyruvate tautomerase PptA (4-oxalocrotonate tautomerase family)
MPLIQCHVSVPLDNPRRQQLIADLIEVTARTLGADPVSISVVVHQHDASSVRELAFVNARPAPG